MDKSQSPQQQELLRMLSGSMPDNCRSETIDFNQTGLLEYKDHFAMVIHNALSPVECVALLRASQEAHQWEEALVNVGNGEQALITDTRLCNRILWDDHDVAAKLLDRILPHLPDDIKVLDNRPVVTGNWPVMKKETWKISRLNERLRFLKYTKGCYFKPHCDALYITPDKQECSYVTVHLYLNDEYDEMGMLTGDGANGDASKPLVGGATRFFSYNGKAAWDFNPKMGSILVFQHRDLLHSGESVFQGTKYTVRSDIMYHRL